MNIIGDSMETTGKIWYLKQADTVDISQVADQELAEQMLPHLLSLKNIEYSLETEEGISEVRDKITEVEVMEGFHAWSDKEIVEEIKNYYEVKVGHLYVGRHDERRNGELQTYELIILATETQTHPNWISGVVISNNDIFSDHQPGNYSTTWNKSSFEPYDGEVLVKNHDRVIIGNSPG